MQKKPLPSFFVHRCRKHLHYQGFGNTFLQFFQQTAQFFSEKQDVHFVRPSDIVIKMTILFLAKQKRTLSTSSFSYFFLKKFPISKPRFS